MNRQRNLMMQHILLNEQEFVIHLHYHSFN